ncbi:hypothetical protein BGZ57DRAFT_329536 [Hyaloscypha finlandica]|nr:hypothetical protein F5882DRAFT_127475 [Hyaloscypha sp. PMI_1271]KAH8794930.1 hypothetical protein BGZ57DRAFT_329536 [Hyaloscypha finlandica]
MCHQVIKIFECGHNKPSKVVRCKRPTSKCGGIFLRQDLENTKGLCVSCRRAATLKSVQQQRSVAGAGEGKDEGYWS